MFSSIANRHILLSVAAVGLLSSKGFGASDFLYVPETSSVTLPSSAGGSTFNLNVYLQAASPTGVSLINSESGIESAGVALSLYSLNGAGSATTITSWTPNAADFSGLSQAASLTPTSLTNDSESAPLAATHGVTFGNTDGGLITNPAANDRIFLGTVGLTVGNAGGTTTTTTFNIGAVDPVNGGFTLTFANLYDLDNQSLNAGGPSYTGVLMNPSEFSITVDSPEPASGLTLLGIGGLFTACRFKARKRSMRGINTLPGRK